MQIYKYFFTSFRSSSVDIDGVVKHSVLLFILQVPDGQISH